MTSIDTIKCQSVSLKGKALTIMCHNSSHSLNPVTLSYAATALYQQHCGIYCLPAVATAHSSWVYYGRDVGVAALQF